MVTLTPFSVHDSSVFTHTVYMCAHAVCIQELFLLHFFSVTLFRWEVLQMVLSVGKNAASSREHRAGLGLAQGENEAADARVWTR